MNTQIYKAIEYFGTQKKLAEAVGVSQPAVAKWLHGLATISPKHAKRIEIETENKITFDDLLPDYFNEPKKSA